MDRPTEFGEWLRCADGKEHHFLSGIALCFTDARVVTPQPTGRSKDGGCINKRFRCGDCVNLHLNRWVTAYQPRGG